MRLLPSHTASPPIQCEDFAFVGVPWSESDAALDRIEVSAGVDSGGAEPGDRRLQPVSVIRSELLDDGTEEFVQIAGLKVMRHPVPDVVQPLDERPGWLVVSSDYGSTQAEHLVEGQSRWVYLVGRSTHTRQHIAQPFLDQKVGS